MAFIELNSLILISTLSLLICLIMFTVTAVCLYKCTIWPSQLRCYLHILYFPSGFALIALSISLFPDWEEWLEVCLSLIEMTCIYNFFNNLCAAAGGKSTVLLELDRIPHVIVCCIPSCKTYSGSIRYDLFHKLVYNGMFVKPLCTLLVIILKDDFYSIAFILYFVGIFALIIAMLSVIRFYLTIKQMRRDEFKHFKIQFTVFKLIIIMRISQNFIINGIDSLSDEEQLILKTMLVAVEAALCGIVFMFLFKPSSLDLENVKISQIVHSPGNFLKMFLCFSENRTFQDDNVNLPAVALEIHHTSTKHQDQQDDDLNDDDDDDDAHLKLHDQDMTSNERLIGGQVLSTDSEQVGHESEDDARAESFHEDII